MYTSDNWVVFDISDTTTIMLIGTYEVQNNSIIGNTRQVITIENFNSYNSTPNITINNYDNREDVVSYSSNLSYRIVSNVENAPTQKNATYETQYKTYETVNIILVALVFAFIYTFIKGVFVWHKK